MIIVSFPMAMPASLLKIKNSIYLIFLFTLLFVLTHFSSGFSGRNHNPVHDSLFRSEDALELFRHDVFFSFLFSDKHTPSFQGLIERPLLLLLLHH